MDGLAWPVDGLDGLINSFFIIFFYLINGGGHSLHINRGL